MTGKEGFFKNQIRYPSLTSETEMEYFCFASEIICVRLAAQNSEELPPFFWRKDVECSNEYKKMFSKGIECFRKLGSVMPHHFIIQCCIYSKIENISYGYIVATMKGRWETWKKNVVVRVNNHVRGQKRRLSIAEDIVRGAQSGSAVDSLAVDEIDHQEIISRSGPVKRKVRF